jgi:hypothetical protein
MNSHAQMMATMKTRRWRPIRGLWGMDHHLKLISEKADAILWAIAKPAQFLSALTHSCVMPNSLEQGLEPDPKGGLSLCLVPLSG